jgi:hypothetical protein
VVHLLSRYHQGSVGVVRWISPESVSIETLLAPRELGMRIACVAPTPIDTIEECYTILAGCTISKIVRERVLTGR